MNKQNWNRKDADEVKSTAVDETPGTSKAANKSNAEADNVEMKEPESPMTSNKPEKGEVGKYSKETGIDKVKSTVVDISNMHSEAEMDVEIEEVIIPGFDGPIH